MYKRQPLNLVFTSKLGTTPWNRQIEGLEREEGVSLYPPDVADEREIVDFGGRRIIKKKKKRTNIAHTTSQLILMLTSIKLR